MHCIGLPKPFNPSTKIEYEVGSVGNVKIDIYNLKGELQTPLLMVGTILFSQCSLEWKR